MNLFEHILNNTEAALQDGQLDLVETLQALRHFLEGERGPRLEMSNGECVVVLSELIKFGLIFHNAGTPVSRLEARVDSYLRTHPNAWQLWLSYLPPAAATALCSRLLDISTDKDRPYVQLIGDPERDSAVRALGPFARLNRNRAWLLVAAMASDHKQPAIGLEDQRAGQ